MGLGLSQPQVSRHIRDLEQTLGVILFVRTARRTELTDAGAELLGDARETLAAAERLGRRARVVGRGGLGAVSVGFVWSTLGGYLAPLVAAAGERHRQIELSVSQLRFAEVISALRRGDIDLVITRPLSQDTELIERVLNHEPSVVAVPAGHPLAQRPAIAPAELDGQPLVSLARELIPSAFDASRAALARYGVHPHEVRQVQSASEALALVSAGLGIYYRMAASAAVPHPGVVYRELSGVPMRTMLVRRPEPPSPAVVAIAGLITDLFGDASLASNNAAAGVEAGISGA